MEQYKLDLLYLKTVQYLAGRTGMIQHFAKVHSFASLIGRSEELEPEQLFTLQAAAIVHDVGILPAEKKFGHSNGKLQEQEGPAVAQQLLVDAGFPENVINRVKYLVAHHHTYTAIDGKDYRILVEADFLVNFFEGNTPKETIISTGREIFRTECAKRLLCDMFGVQL